MRSMTQPRDNLPPTGRSGLQDLAAFGVSLSAVVLAAWIGSLFPPAGAGGWYDQLDRPEWSPPDGLFGPVWTALYALMAIAAWLVWLRRGHRLAVLALAAYALQLALNAAWSPVFFGARSPGGGLVVVVALWVAIVATGVLFARIRPLAAGLLVPYLLWVTFAAALNAAIWHMNA